MPNIALQAALYLTATSTSTVAEDTAPTNPSVVSVTQPPSQITPSPSSFFAGPAALQPVTGSMLPPGGDVDGGRENPSGASSSTSESGNGPGDVPVGAQNPSDALPGSSLPEDAGGNVAGGAQSPPAVSGASSGSSQPQNAGGNVGEGAQTTSGTPNYSSGTSQPNNEAPDVLGEPQNPPGSSSGSQSQGQSTNGGGNMAAGPQGPPVVSSGTNIPPDEGNKVPTGSQNPSGGSQPQSEASDIALGAQKPSVPGSPTINYVPVVMTTTNAQGAVISSTRFAAASPVALTSTNAAGKAAISTSFSILTSPPSPAPLALLPDIVSSTDAQGNVAVSTKYNAVNAVLLTSTNAQGQAVVSTSFSTAPIGASVPTTIVATNSQGALVSSVSYLPAIAFTTTNAQGSQVITTSPLPLNIAATLPSASAITTLPPITINGHAITANSQNQYLVGSQTLTPGGQITVSGVPISLSPSENALIIGSSTENLAAAAITTPPSPPPVLTIGSQTITANSLHQFLIAGSTLTPGGSITVSGTLISLSPDEASLVVGTSTENLRTTAAPPAITIGSQTITANPADQYIVDRQTLTPGGVITVAGTRISLTPDETAVVVGSSTEVLGGSASASATAGVGTSGGGKNDAPTRSGAGSHFRPSRNLWVFVGMMMMGLMILPFI